MQLLAITILGCTTILGMIAAFTLWRQLARQQQMHQEVQGALIEHRAEAAAALERATQFENLAEQLKREGRDSSEQAAKAESAAAVARQQVSDMQQRIADHEVQKKQMTEAASAAVMKIGQDVSTKLLADHKQENEVAKKQAAELTGKLLEQFQTVTGRVEAMSRDNGVLKGEVELMLRTMTHPGGAGKLAEVGLENLLKGFDLEAGRDFETQLHIAGDEGSLRPDAVVYLPQDMILVIDSKASKHMVDIVRSEGAPEEAEHFGRFLKTMNEHARALAHKDYASAMERHCKKQGRAIGRMLSLMYFPSEAFIERVGREDPGLIAFLNRSGIMLVGPTMLYGACRLASTQLAEVRRDTEREKIIEAVSQLMENVAQLFTHAEGMGKGLKKMSEDYAKLIGSLNRNALPRMKKLSSLKVQPAKNKPIPQALPTYQISRHDEMIELDAEEADEDGDKVLALR